MARPRQPYVRPQELNPAIFQIPARQNKSVTIKRPDESSPDSNILTLKVETVVNDGQAEAFTPTVVPSISLPAPKDEVRLNNSNLTPNLNATSSIEHTQANNFQSKLDIYAHKYVPYWLRAINESFAVAAYAPQFQHINYDEYRATFSGTSFRNMLSPVELPPPNFSPLTTSSISSDGYQSYWQERLQNEYAAQSMQNDIYGLYNIDIFPKDRSQHLYEFRLPGLRESTPRVDLGDILFIRPLTQVLHSSIAQQLSEWSIRRDGLAPGFTGIEHHAVVWSVQRRNETVLVKLGRELIRDLKCNVIIPLQAHKNAPTWRTLGEISARLNKMPQPYGCWLNSMLFPCRGHLQTSLWQGKFNLSWYDPALNYQQQKAIQAVIDANYGCVPFLISGPPGTGKTKTMVEIALQLLRSSQQPLPHLLVCAPSDAAADTLLVRLSEHLSQKELFRMNNWTRLPAEVPGDVRPYCFLDNLESNPLHSLPPFDVLMSFKVIVTSCRDADMLIAAGLTNGDLFTMMSRLMSVVSPASFDESKLIHWTALLVDEAAQATEPELLIPLSVVAPTDDRFMESSSVGTSPQLVMAGDEYQLGPWLTSTHLPGQSTTFDASGLETSLFQRLFSSPLYADHPLSRSHGLPPLTREMLPIIRPPFANLIKNYRSHQAILSTSSALFYSDTLTAESPGASYSILSWPRWPRKIRSVWPIMFHQNTSPDSVESVLNGDGAGSGTLMNLTEAQLALDLVTDLIQHVRNYNLSIRDPPNDFLQGEDIIVMSPFRAQVNYLRRLFRDRGYHDIRIGPLEAFQGLEARVVVICTTRTRLGQQPHPIKKFVSEDKSRNLGVIDEPKRFNVAMTRAKEALIVIGSAECLTCTRDPCWVSFLRFCVRNRLYSGAKLSWFGRSTGRENDEVGVGKLESALRYAEQNEESHLRHIGSAAGATNVNGVTHSMPVRTFRMRGQMVDLDEQMRNMYFVHGWDDPEEEEEEEHSTARAEIQEELIGGEGMEEI